MKYITFLLFLLTICTVSGSKKISGNSREEFSIYDPSVFPDRIMLSIPGDPATTRAVSWRTVFSDTVSTGEIALFDPSPEFGDKVKTVSGTSAPWQEGDQSAMGHEVVFKNLQPETKYAYRVGDGQNWSEWFRFETSSGKAEPFSFLYFGDVQTDIKSLGSRILREAYSHFPDADFMLFAGDLVNRSQEDYWKEFFYAGDWIFGTMPSLPTPGNHEYDKPVNQPHTFSKHWKQIFIMPDNAPNEKYRDRTYFLDYQGVRFISFDSPAFGEFNEDSTMIITWLDKTLHENPNPWTVFFTHYPIYSCSQGRNNEKYRNAIQPLLEKYSVDLVLTGHDHSYCRGFNAAGVLIKGKNLPLYVVSIAGSKMYGLNTCFWSDRMGSNIQLYQHISISQKRIEYKSFTVDGKLYDHFIIRKNKRGVNHFSEGAEVKKINQKTEIPKNAVERYTEEELQKYRMKFPGRQSY